MPKLLTAGGEGRREGREEEEGEGKVAPPFSNLWIRPWLSCDCL